MVFLHINNKFKNHFLFTITSKILKYLGIHPVKKLKYLKIIKYSENYKITMQEVEEDTNK